MMSLWDALRMNMMISYQELVRTFLRGNNINVEVVKCKKNEGYILFPIENANDILKKQVPKGG
ncbi:hypothetical protein BMD94_23250 [Klebsiella pneumoniae]|nr:hypothetical protein BMD94_23250 [Klebsiella pneumoniae]OVV04390.1 hypothetical protein BME04_20650 [Klebsiella pneumoniae]